MTYDAVKAHFTAVVKSLRAAALFLKRDLI
jgi:hypothetical protein